MSFEDLESGWVLPFDGRIRELVVQQEEHRSSSSRAIVAGIFQMNTAVASFLRLVNAIGTPKDTLHLRHKLRQSRLHIAHLVKETSTKLKQATETDQHTEVSTAKKIADAKLAKDFQSVLREFQKAQRLAAERETAYAPIVPEEVLPSRREVLLVENEIALNEATIEERDQGIREIQQQIGEVNEIFKDLAVLVCEQGTMIDDISSNIGNTHLATEQATFQITEASKTQKSVSSMLWWHDNQSK